ncbi:MAG: diaminopimelate decarboxylase [Candidatus Pelagibacter sp. TMED118]|nr:MAG: diaminopimelate decarboxylase [Candidatus Pelagibacter sp. TMED118]|tara:strand:+ start:4308 stop:5522 length:1215 start_codon:yes stop_codon:yes gene_type:complete
MKYIDGSFFIEKVSANKISKKFGTPTYVYSYEKICENISNFKKYFNKIDPLVCFSVKSNANLNILKIIKNQNVGADVVSKGEMIAALKTGINPKKIVFSGVGKTSDEIDYAIKKNILLINAESEDEVSNIEKIAKKNKRRIGIGIRLNPDIDAKTINKISTGKKENKFGVDIKSVNKIIKKFKNSRFLDFSCLSVHIGSQITSHKPYKIMLDIIQECINLCKHNFKFIDLGGGMGIKYNKSDKKLNYKKYNDLIEKFLIKNKVKIIFEPGRSIIGNTGVLLSKVVYVKKTSKKNFIILDAAMNDFMRPALYGANHRLIPSKIIKKKIKKKHEFVGPVCETTDKFSEVLSFQKIINDDLMIICDVGAYGIALSSNYNLRPIPPEILIKGSDMKIIRKRQKITDLI